MQLKDFLKSILNSRITLPFLFTYDKYVHTLPQFPRKLYQIQAKRGSLHSFLDRNGVKTIPYRAAHTFMACIWKKHRLLPPSEAIPGVLLYAN